MSKKVKLKTHRGAAKRFKKTGSGKLKRKHAYKNHILTKKSIDRKRKLRQVGEVHASDVAGVTQMLAGQGV